MRFFLRRESTAEPVGCQAAASFTGALHSSPLDATNIATGFGGNPTMSLTTITANDLVTAMLSHFLLRQLHRLCLGRLVHGNGRVQAGYERKGEYGDVLSPYGPWQGFAK
jgi:hypothetical protein